MKQNISVLAREHGVSPQVLHYRLKVGWPLSKALTAPVHRGGWNKSGTQPRNPDALPQCGQVAADRRQVRDHPPASTADCEQCRPLVRAQGCAPKGKTKGRAAVRTLEDALVGDLPVRKLKLKARSPQQEDDT